MFWRETDLIDHSIRPIQQRLRNRHADLLGGFEIEHQLELLRLFHGKIGGFGAFEDLVHSRVTEWLVPKWQISRLTPILRIAANHLYNRVKPDGFTIGAWASPLVLQQIMGNEAAQFDGRRFGYLGIPSEYDTVCTFNQQSGITKMDDWIHAKRPQKISTIGPGTSTSDIPKLLKAALNLPMDVIDGYKGGADARLAVESGEVDGYCGSWGTVETVWRSSYVSRKIVPVLQASLTSHARHNQVPLAINYAKSDETRELLQVADSAHSAQFPFSVPPGMAKERLELLQSAFVKTFKDPDLAAEAKRSQLDVEPVDGPIITKSLSSLYELKPAT